MRAIQMATENSMAAEAFTQALDDSSELELTVTGRTTGREFSIPVWFVREGDTVDLVPIHGTDSGWFKNVRKTPTIRLRVGDAADRCTRDPDHRPRPGRAGPRQVPREVRRRRCGELLPEARRGGGGANRLSGARVRRGAVARGRFLMPATRSRAVSCVR